VSKAELKKYWGFVLHFGYVESSYVSNILIHHTGDGFDTLKEAVTDLAHVFLDDYLDGFKYEGTPTLEGFEHYLYEQPSCNASAGPSFLVNDWNAERWWAWDSLTVLYPYLDKFWENDEPAENIFPRYLEPARINHEQMPHIFKSPYGYKLKPEAIDALRAEVIKLQTPPKDEWGLKLWKSVTGAKTFNCVGVNK
jgi:hypothetical protein